MVTLVYISLCQARHPILKQEKGGGRGRNGVRGRGRRRKWGRRGGRGGKRRMEKNKEEDEKRKIGRYMKSKI